VLENEASEDNVPLAKRDEIRIFSERDFSETYNVNVEGAVRNPGGFVYGDKLRLRDAIYLAGGVKPNAYLDKGYIVRTFDNLTKEYLEFNLRNALEDENSKDNMLLQKKDVIRVFSESDFFDSYNVTIEGEVRNPGEFIYGEKLKVRDIILLAGGVKENTYLEKAYIVRTMPDLSKRYINFPLDSVMADETSKHNVYLQKRDRIRLFSEEEFLDEYTVSISGEVHDPGEFAYGDSLRVRDLIYFANGVTDKAYMHRGYVLRHHPDLTKEYINFDVEQVLTNPKAETNLLLEKMDEVTIFSKERFREFYQVSVEGAVRSPDTFTYGTGMTLKDILFWAGGLKPEAANNIIEISRVMNFEEAINQSVATRTVIKMVSVKHDLSIDQRSEQFELMPMDQVFVRLNPDFELQQNVQVTGEVKYPGAYSLKDKEERLMNIIERAGGFTDEAYWKGTKLVREDDGVGVIFVDIKKAKRRKRSRFNYTLRKDDHIHVPREKHFVSITGMIQYPDIETIGKINAPLKKRKRAKYYIKRYGGGFAKGADRKRVYVKYQNDEIKKARWVIFFRLYPKPKDGSIIVVPKKRQERERPEAPEPEEKRERTPVDWNAVLQTLTAGITSALTIYLLVLTLQDRNKE